MCRRRRASDGPRLRHDDGGHDELNGGRNSGHSCARFSCDSPPVHRPSRGKNGGIVGAEGGKAKSLFYQEKISYTSTYGRMSWSVGGSGPGPCCLIVGDIGIETFINWGH